MTDLSDEWMNGPSITERAKAAGINRSVVYQRLARGWSLERALQPVESLRVDYAPGEHPDDVPCEVCGNMHRRNAWKRDRGLGRTCSVGCAAALRRGQNKIRKRSYELCGVALTLKELGEIGDVIDGTVATRIRSGRSVAKSLLSWGARRLLGEK